GIRDRARRPRRVSACPHRAAQESRPAEVASRLPRERLLRPDRVRIHRYAVTFLVDANVLSEVTKPDPDPRVLDWLARHEREVAVDQIGRASCREECRS